MQHVVTEQFCWNSTAILIQSYPLPIFLGYGQQRMFGSLAWGSGAFISGYLIDAYGMNTLFYYTYFFNIASFFFVVFVLPSSRTVSHSVIVESENKIEDEDVFDEKNGEDSELLGASPEMTEIRSRSKSTEKTDHNSSFQHQQQQRHAGAHGHKRGFNHYMKELSTYLSNAPCRAILINSFLYGVVMTVPDTFLFVSVEQDFKASRTYSGLLTSTSILACLPLFWFSGGLIMKYGHYKLIFTSQFTCIARLILYSLLAPDQSMSLYFLPCIQLIHGLNFALYWSAAIDAIHKLAPAELQTICIAALNVSFYTFGGAAGNVIWGHLYDYSKGIFYVYLYSSLLLFCTVVLLRSQCSILNTALSSHASEMNTQ